MGTIDDELIARLRNTDLEPPRTIGPAPLGEIRGRRARRVGVRTSVLAVAALTLAVIAGGIVLGQQGDSEDPVTAVAPTDGPSSEPGESSKPCATPQPSTTSGEAVIRVYFICTKTTVPSPVYRTVDSASSDKKLVREALEAYFDGPTPEERKAGLIAPLGASLGDVPATITMTGGAVEVSFFGDLRSQVGSILPQQRDFLIDSLRRTATRFKSVKRLELTHDGDCAAFWELAGSRCLPITQ